LTLQIDYPRALSEDDYWFYFNEVPSEVPADTESLSDPQKLNLLDKWKRSVSTENTQSAEQKLSNIREVPRLHITKTTRWTMDRVKEAIDSYVRGHWLASISLCGTIAELVSIHLLLGHFEGKGINVTEAPELRTMVQKLNQHARLTMLRKAGVLTKEERKKLDSVRTTRNDYMHLNKKSESGRSDCLKVIKDLVDFLNSHPLP
jgi:hypothetical protein